MSNTIDTDEFLQHFGVKGMRWGHTTGGADGGGSSSGSGSSSKGGGSSSSGGGSSSKSAKPTSADIKTARKNVREKAKDLGAKEDAYYSATTTKGREKALNVFKKAENKFMNDPEVALSEQHTRGEKIANGLSNVMVGALIVGGVVATVASKR